MRPSYIVIRIEYKTEDGSSVGLFVHQQSGTVVLDNTFGGCARSGATVVAPAVNFDEMRAHFGWTIADAVDALV